MDRRQCCTRSQGPRQRGPPQRDRGPRNPQPHGWRRRRTRCCRSPRYGHRPAEVSCRPPEDRPQQSLSVLALSAASLISDVAVLCFHHHRMDVCVCVLLPDSGLCRPAFSRPAAGGTGLGEPLRQCRRPARHRSCHTLRVVPHTRTEGRSRSDRRGTWGHICKHKRLHPWEA